MTDQINHPQHYGGADNPYEAIKVIEAWGLGFCLGNTVKYISRAGKKADPVLQDLKKARWYLDREIANIEAVPAEEREALERTARADATAVSQLSESMTRNSKLAAENARLKRDLEDAHIEIRNLQNVGARKRSSK